MTMIIKDDKTFKIGRDLVDAMTGAMQSHGVLETNWDERLPWVSTLPIAETESAIRAAARRECIKIVYFESQAA